MRQHMIGFWNVENLFAPENHAQRVPSVARRMGSDLENWSDALFQRKISQLASIIVQMNGGAGPDILGVCEVEDAFVLEKLAAALNSRLGSRSYSFVHHDSELDKRGIDTAFLYDQDRYTVDQNTVFSHFVLRRTGTRDILQASFRTQSNNDLILMCNHWPSRSGGAEASAGFRAAAGESLAYWHERVREEVGPRAALVAVGDFNDDPFDPSLRFNALSTRERGDVERATKAPRLYNLGWRFLTKTVTDHRGDARELYGTLYFKGDANLFDQILVSKPLLDGDGPFHLREETAQVETYSEMISHRVSEGPIRFGLPKNGVVAGRVNEDGFSDHFPVSVIVTED